MLKRFARVVFQGLAAVLPLAVTLYVIWWIGLTGEKIFQGPIKWLLNLFGEDAGAKLYAPGMGFVAGIIVLVAVGVLARFWIAQKLIGLSDNILKRIPLAKTVYGSVKDLLSVFSSQKKSFSHVGFLEIPGTDMKVLGMITRDDFSGFTEVPDDHVSMYLPMSYQIGGFTFLVPRENVTEVDMSVEDALRFAMTAGVSGGARAAPAPPQPEALRESDAATAQEAGQAPAD